MSFDLNKIHDMRKRGFSSAKATSHMKLENIISDMEEVDTEMLKYSPRISESMFVNNFLMAFAGRGESIEENYAIYLRWVSDVAGSYNVPVHVCSDSNKDEILFTVPAVTNVRTLNPSQVDVREVNKAIQMAEDAKFLQPFNYEKILEQNLNGLLKKVYDKNNVVTGDQLTWLTILKRYESNIQSMPALVKINVPGSESLNENKTKQAVSKNEITYSEVEDPL